MASYQQWLSRRRRFLIIEPQVPGLCEMCQDFEKGKITLLFKAVEKGHLDCVKAGADVNVSFDKDQGPLSCAIDKGFDDCVEVLIKAGALIYSS